MDIINREYKYNESVINSMEQNINIYARSHENKNTRKGDVRIDINIFSKQC